MNMYVVRFREIIEYEITVSADDEDSAQETAFQTYSSEHETHSEIVGESVDVVPS